MELKTLIKEMTNEVIEELTNEIVGEKNTKGDIEKIERLKGAEELEAIAKKFASITPKNRIVSIVVTKLEEACLWYAKFLKEDN